METLRARFARQLPENVKAIETELQRLGQENRPGHEWEELHRLVHTLAGSAPVFGYKNIGDLAREAELLVKQIKSGTRSPVSSEILLIQHCIDGMKEVLASESQAPEPSPDAPETSGPPEAEDSWPTKGRTIFIVDDDSLMLERLAGQIRCFGYDVQAFSALEGLPAAVSSQHPAAIIMDMIFPEGDLAGAQAITELQKHTPKPIPIIFISRRQSLAARYAAVKAGGEAYFYKPPSISSLIDKLDELTAVKTVEPYHILIVDDDPALSYYYSLVLEQHGMITRVVNNPMQILDCISGFEPDLILMDIYMPEYNGYDLAKVIRQMESYVSVPIVFLSRETDQDKQQSAMQTGGDDFLTKPITPERLVAAVSIRAERMRVVRTFMERDSLTGLLNHSKIEEQLQRAILLAARGHRLLTCAMIDIDRFKSINDRYGHQVGDQVLIVLSRLMQQRLRASDIAGRYGGEEFLVILPDTDTAAASQVLNELRQAFAQIRHESEHGEFFVTFSAGVATFPDYPSALALTKAADQALYLAKNRGRNLVVSTTKGSWSEN